MTEKYSRRSENLGFAAKLCGFVTGFHSFIISVIFVPKLLDSGLFFEYLRNPPTAFIVCILLGIVGLIATCTLIAISSHYRTKAEEYEKEHEDKQPTRVKVKKRRTIEENEDGEDE